MSRGKYLNASSISFTACDNPAVWAEQQICLLKPISQLEERRGGGEWSRENFGAFLFNSTQKSQQNLPLLCKHTYTHTATAERLTNQSRMCESRYGVTVPGEEICELTPSSATKHHLERMDSNKFTVCSVSFNVKVFSKHRLEPNSQSR